MPRRTVRRDSLAFVMNMTEAPLYRRPVTGPGVRSFCLSIGRPASRTAGLHSFSDSLLKRCAVHDSQHNRRKAIPIAGGIANDLPDRWHVVVLQPSTQGVGQ